MEKPDGHSNPSSLEGREGCRGFRRATPHIRLDAVSHFRVAGRLLPPSVIVLIGSYAFDLPGRPEPVHASHAETDGGSIAPSPMSRVRPRSERKSILSL
jgi:hypothetical protein